MIIQRSPVSIQLTLAHKSKFIRKILPAVNTMGFIVLLIMINSTFLTDGPHLIHGEFITASGNFVL